MIRHKFWHTSTGNAKPSKSCFCCSDSTTTPIDVGRISSRCLRRRLDIDPTRTDIQSMLTPSAGYRSDLPTNTYAMCQHWAGTGPMRAILTKISYGYNVHVFVSRWMSTRTDIHLSRTSAGYIPVSNTSQLDVNSISRKHNKRWLVMDSTSTRVVDKR